MSASSVRALVSILAVACATPDDAPTDAVVDALPDPTTCGATCGDGPLYVIDSIRFPDAPVDGVVEGFDLDGLGADGEADCGVTDGINPDGVPGIDNRFATILGVLPPTLLTTLPAIFDTAITTGNMTILIELVTTSDPAGPAELVFRAGAGPVALGGDGRLLSDQTLDVAGEPPLGVVDVVRDADGGLTAGPFDLGLHLTVLDTTASFRVLHARLALHPEDDGRLDGLLGGVVPLEDVLAITAGLGGAGDATIKAALEQVLPLVVDARTDPAGDCDAISGTFTIGAVPAFVFEGGMSLTP